MKLKLLYCFLLGSLAALSLKAQVSLTATAGTTSGSYTTLSGAFNAINAGTHKGVIAITLTGNITETTTIFIDSSGNGTGSSYTSISVKPFINTSVTVSGAIAGTLVSFGGADKVTFDGLNVGSASLTLSNTDATVGSSTLKFANDASGNRFLNLTIKGAAAIASTPASGTIFFAGGNVTGNDNNYFFNSNIDGTGSSACLLFSAGTGTSPSTENSNDSLVNCRFYDFYSTTVASPYGVLLYGGNTDWYISGNSFYQTTSRASGLQGLPSSLTIFPDWTTDQHTVIGNYSGGSAANAAGSSIYTATGTNVLGYIGFNIQTGGPANIIQNNTVQNVSVTYGATAGSFTNAAFTAFIGGYSGTFAFTGNTVNSFSITNTAGSALGSAMAFNGRVTTAATTVKPVFTITNNTISNVTFNAGGTGSAQFYGIRLETSSGNALTSTTTISNPYFIVSGNTVTGLSSTAGGASGLIRAIGTVLTNGTSSTCPLWPKALIQNNIISGVSCFSNLANAANNTAVGIQYAGAGNVANSVDTIFIKGNTIYNLSSPNTADLASSVAGIIGTNGLYSVTENKIYGLSNSSPGTATQPFVTGINIRASLGNTGIASVVANNFISLGTGNTGNVSYFGILNNTTATNAINVYYNSVYIGGTASSGGNNSACLYRGSEVFTGASVVTTAIDIKDNIFVNQRSGGTGANYAIAAYSTGTWTSNYNNLNVSNAANTAYYGGAAYTLAAYQAAATSDANSKAVAVNFVATATGDLHLTGASNGDANLRGVVIPGFPTDIDGQARNVWNTYMGADEAAISLPLQLLSFQGQLKNANATLSWTTAGEINADRFEIERSGNGSIWTNIVTVSAKGAANNSYQITDAGLTSGKWFYRLKMIDKDGNFKYSQVVVLELSGKNLFVLNQNYPNPVKGTTQLSYQVSEDAKVVIELLSNDGKKVATLVNQQQGVGTYNITLDLTKYALSTGNYAYRMVAFDKNNNQIFTATKKMVLTK